MTKSTWLLGVVSVVAVLNACQSPPSAAPSEADTKQMEQRVREYFTETLTLPPGVTMKLTAIAPAAVPGLLTATLELSKGTQTQSVPLLLSRDGHYMVQGHLTDLTIDPSKAVMEKIALKDLPSRGNPDAPVTIVEYSDFQCPFCGRAYKMLEDQVLKEYAGKVRVVFKNFPLTNMHPWAESAAVAGACARQQSPQAFWKVYDFLFQNQKDITVENLKEKTEGVIRDAGADVGKFDACFDNKATLDAVRADMHEATLLGVHSTPTFFINGRKLEGAVPYDSFKAAIDAALGASPAKAG
jgi:protein-disulfide isomerase